VFVLQGRTIYLNTAYRNFVSKKKKNSALEYVYTPKSQCPIGQISTRFSVAAHLKLLSRTFRKYT